MSAQVPPTLAGTAALLQTLGPFTLGSGMTWVTVTSRPRVLGTGIEIDFENSGTWACAFADNPDPPVESHFLASPPTTLELRCSRGTLQAWDEAEKTATYVAAWRKLAALGAAETDGERASFEAAAEAFRSGQAGPEIGEDVRMHKVLAEAAVRDKRYWDAADEFGQGLALAPWWPQGNFNAALMYAELKAYPLAVRYMQRYLKLAPKAGNARAVQDKVYEWQGEAKRAGG